MSEVSVSRSSATRKSVRALTRLADCPTGQSGQGNPCIWPDQFATLAQLARGGSRVCFLAIPWRQPFSIIGGVDGQEDLAQVRNPGLGGSRESHRARGGGPERGLAGGARGGSAVRGARRSRGHRLPCVAAEF